MLLYLAIGAIATIITGYIGYAATVKAVTVAQNDGISTHRPQEGIAPSNKLIVIFGWGGAQTKHFRRVIEYHNSRGHTVICYIGSMALFLDQGVFIRSLFPLFNEIHQFINGLKTKEEQHALEIIPHIHSNTGFYLYATFLHLLKTSKDEAKISPNSPDFKYLIPKLKAVVWDSAPLFLPLESTIKPSKEWLDIIHTEDNKLKNIMNDDATPLPIDEMTKKLQEIKIDYDCNRIDNPIVMLSQIMGIAPAYVPLILKKNTYIHPFWTPAVVLGMFGVFIRNSLYRQYRKYVLHKQDPIAVPANKLECIPLFFAKCWYGADKDYFSTPLPKDDCSLYLPKVTNDQIDPKYLRTHIEYAVDELIPFIDIVEGWIKSPFTIYNMTPKQLFVYSKKDFLIGSKSIERSLCFFQFIGVDCYQLCFDKTLHVQHFLKQPEEYSKALDNFFGTIINTPIVNQLHPSKNNDNKSNATLTTTTAEAKKEAKKLD